MNQAGRDLRLKVWKQVRVELSRMNIRILEEIWPRSDKSITLFPRGISPLDGAGGGKIALFSYRDYVWQD